MRYLIGAILKFEIVKKKLHNNAYSRVTDLGNNIVAVFPFHTIAQNDDDIAVGVFSEPCYFDGDENLYTTSVSETETKKVIDKMFAIDAKMTYITIF